MSSQPPRSEFRVLDATLCMITILRALTADVVLWSSVDESGSVGPGGCVEVRDGVDVFRRLVEQAAAVKARRLLLGSRVSEPLQQERLAEFTRGFHEEALRAGIVVERHLLVSSIGHSSITWGLDPPASVP